LTRAFGSTRGGTITQGGRGKMYQLFGKEMNTIISELNEVLAA